MKKNILARVILSMAMVLSVIGFIPSAQATHQPVHVLQVSGISTFPGACEYVEAVPRVVDELGIPKPSTLPPTCKRNASNQIVGCHIARNLNPTPITKPACAGNISAEDSFGVGCIDPMSTIVTCSLRAPTWFYGYCGQTYGGANAGTFTINGTDYTIERTGFTRGRGAWEFSGRMHPNSNPGAMYRYRMHLAAAPDKPGQAAGCDVTNDIESVVFAGVMEIYAPGVPVPPKTFRTSTGWHWCDDDQPVKPGSPGENC